MNATLASWRQLLRGVLPYPDPRRRWRIRRKALKLVTCKTWPGDDATGMEAAQVALLRLLWLQQLTRDAVLQGRGDDAALLARAAVETCIVGLYCVHSGDSIARMSAASFGASAAASYLISGDLGSVAAIDGAVGALGQVGPDPDVRDLALWLERERGLETAAWLYYEHYVPLSHLFTHAYAFGLMRHVEPDGTLTARPAFPWIRRSAVRMVDGCTGLLAGHVADKSGVLSEPFLRYSADHLDRILAPALVFAIKGALRSVPRRKRPGALSGIVAGGRHRGTGPAQDHAQAREDVPGSFDSLFDEGPPDQAFVQPVSQYLPDLPSPAGEEWAAEEWAEGEWAGEEWQAR